MRYWIKVLAHIAGLVSVTVLAACGSSSSGNSGPATLRVINATRSSTLTVTVNGTSQLASVAQATASAFVSLAAGNETLTVASTTGLLTSSTQTVSLVSGQNYSLLAFESRGSIRTVIFAENQVVPLSGFGSINVANLSTDAGPLDVYILAPGTTSLAGVGPTFQYVSGTTIATTLVAGTYSIIATAAGNQNDVRFILPSLTISGTQVQTLALTGTVGGALVDGVLFTQAGGVQFAPTSYARVRVVSALPAADNLAVAATVGTASLNAVYAPNPGVYTLVPGNASTYSVGVAGIPAANLPAANFAAGGDSTILVYGSPSSPLVAVYTDNNHQPDGGQISLRLVNAAVTAPSGLTLYDNNVAVANSVGFGAASAYVGTTASNTSVLQLVQPGVPPVTVTVALVSGSVYTIFVLDGSLTPYIIKDR
jgi:hypothetical protein